MAEINDDIDKVFAESGAQGKLYCWFNRNRRYVYIYFGALLTLLLLFVCFVVIKNNRLHNMQRDYLAINSTDSKLAFIKKYRAQPLCGIVLLDLGDDAEKRGEFHQAVSYYDLAIKALHGHDLCTRARISRALSKLHMRDQVFFDDSLSDILHDEQICMNFRSDALYKLASYFRHNEIKISELMHYADGLKLSENWRQYIESVVR